MRIPVWPGIRISVWEEQNPDRLRVVMPWQKVHQPVRRILSWPGRAFIMVRYGTKEERRPLRTTEVQEAMNRLYADAFIRGEHLQTEDEVRAELDLSSTSETWQAEHEDQLRAWGVSSGAVDGIRSHQYSRAFWDQAARTSDAIMASYRPCSVCGASDHAGVVHDEHVPVDEGLVAYANTQADDQKAVEAGMVSPAAFHETWACWPRLTFEVHQIWCGRKHEDAAGTGYPTWYACTEWQAVR